MLLDLVPFDQAYNTWKLARAWRGNAGHFAACREGRVLIAFCWVGLASVSAHSPALVEGADTGGLSLRDVGRNYRGDDSGLRYTGSLDEVADQRLHRQTRECRSEVTMGVASDGVRPVPKRRTLNRECPRAIRLKRAEWIVGIRTSLRGAARG